MYSIPAQRHPFWLTGFFALIWLAVLGAGFFAMAKYDTTPGTAHTAPIFWPKMSTLVPTPNRWNLVMFLHPQCPCSRASLDELNVVMNAEQAKDASAWVVFLKPTDRDDEWVRTFTWQKAGDIRHVTRRLDAGGIEATRFKAETSGFLALYDETGRLRFSGGITGARGEDGDNLGRESVLQLLAGKPEAHTTHAVFGCSLVDLPTMNIQFSENALP
jgi:hypothetical protein